MNNSSINQAVIGAFVVGAVMLVVIAVVLFGSGNAFRQSDRFVMYFEGSVKGLNIGAPVTFRGVRIGRVVDITLRANPETLIFSIPVIIEVETDTIERSAEIVPSHMDVLQRLINKGLRAKLDLQSIITGQLFINLEILPDEPIRLSGVKHRYREIPTVPNTLARLAKKLEDMPIEKMVNDASTALQSLQTLLSNPALPQMVERLNQVGANLQELTATLNRRAEPLTGSFQNIADQADEALNRINASVERFGRAADAIGELADGAQSAVDNAGEVLANVAGMTDPSAKERYELRRMINELSEAARAIRDFSNYLERHPEALIRGKKNPQGR